MTESCPLDLNGPRDVAYTPLRKTMAGQALPAWLAAAATLHAGRTAIDDGKQALGYTALWQAARRMAVLIHQAVPAAAPVAVVLRNNVTYPVAWIGCLLARRPAALLDAHQPQDRNRHCIETARPAAVIGRRDDPHARSLAGDLPFLAIEDAFNPAIEPLPHHAAAAVPAPADEPAFIIFTSGSTGAPKGVALSAAAALDRATTLIDSVHMNPNDTMLSAIPPSALGGPMNVLETYLAGATLLKTDMPRVSVSVHAGKTITMLFATPAILRLITQLDTDGALRRHLRCAHPIGDAMLQADLRQLRTVLPPDCHVFNAYGSTEALVSLQWFIPAPYTRDGAKVAAGYPLPGCIVRLETDDGRPAADGEPGELIVSNPFMSLGAWQDGRLSPGPFQSDPADPASRIHRTGDMAIRAPDGVYTVIGRRDRQVKIRGNRVEPSEIEAAIASLPDVGSVIVLARPGRDGEPELIAVVVPNTPHSDALRLRIMQASRERLPSYMHPNRIILRHELPLLPGGKTDLHALLASLDD